jgi:hypothetical protein
MTREIGSFYFGNAAIDQIRGTGWFVGQFVPPDWGLRHQTDVELKWAIHADGEQRRHGPEANGNATTISVLIHGVPRATFHIDGTPHVVTFRKKAATSSSDPTSCIPGGRWTTPSSSPFGFLRSRLGEHLNLPTAAKLAFLTRYPAIGFLGSVKWCC